MKILLTTCVALCALTASATAEKQYQLKDLSPAIQKTIQDEAKGGDIKSITRETEHGVQQYEVETLLNGKHRDFNVDSKGSLVVVEEETTLDSIPPVARAAILKKVADGKLGMVESVKRAAETLYEASYTAKSGKKHEVLVKADGSETKD
jgi:hypothetical protein